MESCLEEYREGDIVCASGCEAWWELQLSTLVEKSADQDSLVDPKNKQRNDELRKSVRKHTLRPELEAGFVPGQDSGQVLQAHSDAVLLVLTKSALDCVVNGHARHAQTQRAELLRRHMPAAAEISAEVLDKITGLFHEEVRTLGSTLVRASEMADFIWIVMEGHCTSLSRPQRHTDCSPGCDDPEVPRPVDGCNLTTDPQSFEPPPTGSRGVRAPQPLAIHAEGRFVGLISGILGRPEPSTVVASSARVRLLACSKSDIRARVPVRIFEGLKAAAQQETDWHSHRAALVAELPGQVDARMAEIRREVQQQSVPRVLHSRFLRRQGQPELDTLNAVCSRFGCLVHPESEWQESSKSARFFHNLRLAGAAPCQHQESANPDGDLAALQFQQIRRQIQVGKDDNSYLAPAVLQLPEDELTKATVSSIQGTSFQGTTSSMLCSSQCLVSPSASVSGGRASIFEPTLRQDRSVAPTATFESPMARLAVAPVVPEGATTDAIPLAHNSQVYRNTGFSTAYDMKDPTAPWRNLEIAQVRARRARRVNGLVKPQFGRLFHSEARQRMSKSSNRSSQRLLVLRPGSSEGAGDAEDGLELPRRARRRRSANEDVTDAGDQCPSKVEASVADSPRTDVTQSITFEGLERRLGVTGRSSTRPDKTRRHLEKQGFNLDRLAGVASNVALSAAGVGVGTPVLPPIGSLVASKYSK